MAKFDPFLTLDCAGLEGGGGNPRKGRDQILQRCGAEPQSFKPKGPNANNLWPPYLESLEGILKGSAGPRIDSSPE